MLDNKPESASTKQKILDCAIKLFAAQGYTETSIRELAAAVGVKEASIYNHFPSKNAILECILEEFAEITSKIIKQNQRTALENMFRDTPTADGILHYLVGDLAFPKGKEEYHIKQLYVILQEQHRNALVRKFICDEYILVAEDAIRAIIEKLKELNKIRPDTDPDFWAKTYSSLIYSFSSRMLLGIGDQAPGFSGLGLMGLLRRICDLMLKTCSVENN